MNTSTILSFAIGAVLLLAVLSLNSRMLKDSSNVAIDQINKQKLGDVVTLLSSDFRKIGFDVDGNALVSADANQIEFKGDLNDDGEIDDVSWQLDLSKPDLSTKNPNDYDLIRTVNGVSTDIDIGVTKFNIVLKDSLGQVVGSLDNARQVQVQIVCQAPEKMGDTYNETAWQKTFVPWNLR